nr:MAG TPA: hypothetical protein [Caudoviricetes sp.]
MKHSKKNRDAYQAVYQPLFDKLKSGNFFPNVPAIRKVIRELDKRMDTLCSGVVFAKDLEEVNRVDGLLDILKGQKRAYQDIIKYVNGRIGQQNLQTIK